MEKEQDFKLTTYVAFLRGVNMLGSKVIKMRDLADIFVASGFQQVKTCLASGNVLFQTRETHFELLRRQVEEAIAQGLGYSVHVFLRTMAEVEEIANQNPFKHSRLTPDAKRYVTFLSGRACNVPALPITSEKGDYTILQITELEVYSLVFPLGNGRYGTPVGYIEKAFDVLSTTRNWTTIEKIINSR
jgi:uncharacterized protein (DUF1697 family)